MHAYGDDIIVAVTWLETCLNHVMTASRLELNAEKTDLLWAWFRYSSEAQQGSSGLSVQLGGESVSASDDVHVLWVTISSDLSLDKHMSMPSLTSQSLDNDSMKTPSSCHQWTTVMPFLPGLQSTLLTSYNIYWIYNTSRHRYTKAWLLDHSLCRDSF